MVNTDLIIQNPSGLPSTPEISEPATGLRALFIDRENIQELPHDWTENSCGFYILLSRIREDDSYDAFVGKVIKGFAGILKEHDETKTFWKTAILIKMDTGFSINQAAYLEGKAREILSSSEAVTLRNVRPPWDHEPSARELPKVQSAMEFSLRILALRGYMRAPMASTVATASESINNTLKAVESDPENMPQPPFAPVRPPWFDSSLKRVSSIGKPIMERKPEVTQEDIFIALKAWRTGRANSENVPAYVITNNRTLEDIASMKPRDKTDLIKVPGMGKKRVELYGEEILRIVASQDPLLT